MWRPTTAFGSLYYAVRPSLKALEKQKKNYNFKILGYTSNIDKIETAILSSLNNYHIRASVEEKLMAGKYNVH
jgi:Zn-dependent M28 family amino/carboxypeptidase